LTPSLLTPCLAYNGAVDTLKHMLEASRLLDLGPLPAPRLAPVATVQQSLQFLVRGRRGAIVVVDGMRPIGIFTERDVVHRMPTGLFTSRQEREHTPVRDVMSQPPVTVRRQAKLVEAVETMARLSHRHLVVVDRKDELRGLLTTGDIIQFLTDQFPEETINLPPRLRQLFRSSEGA